MSHFVARPHSPALAQLIAAFHYHEATIPAAVERILPTGQAHLLINLEEDRFRTYRGSDLRQLHRMSGAVLAGPHGCSTAIDTVEQRWMMAVEFKIAGAAAFFRAPLYETCNDIVELDDLWGVDGRTLRERLLETPPASGKFDVLEAILLSHLVRPSDPAIHSAVSLLERGLSVAAVRERLGLLPKTFVRRVREQVGLTPKRLARVRRLQRTLGSVLKDASPDWSEIAAEHGFNDQAHLIHDFRDLTGITPAAYRPPSSQRRNHIPIATLQT